MGTYVSGIQIATIMARLANCAVTAASFDWLAIPENMTIERPVSVTLDVVERRSQILDQSSHLCAKKTIVVLWLK